MGWLQDLPYDPIQPLISSEHFAIEYWTKSALLKQALPPPQEILWDLPVPQKILRRQNTDGSWSYPTERTSAAIDYNQLETYRQLGFLVEMFGFTREHYAIAGAAEYIFSKQTPDGDIRGIYAHQYTPNYTAALLELLVKAGYQEDERIARAFRWLSDMRQDDGGWALAVRTQGRKLEAIYDDADLMQPERTKPFSHFVTGVVLRAYAAHPVYCHGLVAAQAADLLASRLFMPDKYSDRGSPSFWTGFSFPFWQTDILSALDTIGQINPALGNEQKVLQAKQWFVNHQQPDGLFTGHLLKDRYHDLQLWYSFAICRAFKRFHHS